MNLQESVKFAAADAFAEAFSRPCHCDPGEGGQA